MKTLSLKITTLSFWKKLEIEKLCFQFQYIIGYKIISAIEQDNYLSFVS